MDSPDDSALPVLKKPRGITVIGCFVAAAGMISYLAAYALTDALVKVEFLTNWQPGQDPRPRRFMIGFIGLVALFTTVAGLLRILGRKGGEDDPEDTTPEEPPAHFPYAPADPRPPKGGQGMELRP